MSQIRPLLAFLGFAAAVTALLLRVIFELGAEPDPVERKVLTAERHIYYRVTPAAGPHFALESDERLLRFITHARVPEPAAYDPTREVSYGLHLEVVADGALVWSRDVHARARQSKARRHGAAWLDENTFSLEDQRLEVSDDRQLLVQLPAELPPGATLRVRLVDPAPAAAAPPDAAHRRRQTPPATEAFVRVLARSERSSTQQQRRLEALVRGGREPYGELGYLPWHRLSRAERLARLRFTERVLAASGREGNDYQLAALYDSGFRLAQTSERASALALTAQHAIAVNVTGPATLALRLWRPGSGDPPAAVTVQRISDGDLPPAISVEIPSGGAAATHPLEVPAGIHSLYLRTEAEGTIDVELAAPPGVVAGFGAGATALVPDLVQLPAYLSGPEGDAIAFSVDGPDDQVGHTVRIDVRVLASEQRTNAELIAELEGAGGKLLGTTRAEVPASAALFEEAVLFGDERAAVTEPVAIRIIAPRGTRRLRLRTSQPALVRASTLLAASPAPDELAAPYRDAPQTTTMWRYGSYLHRGWQPVRAENHAALSPKRTVKLVAQTRLAPAPAPARPQLAAEALVPEDRTERQVVLEHIDAQAAPRVLAHWTEGDYVRIEPGVPARLDLASLPSAPRIRYWATGAAEGALGHDVEVSVDGKVVVRDRIRASRGGWTLPPQLAGVHDVLVTTRAPGLRLLADRRPVSGQNPLYALRTVYHAARPLRLHVVKGAAPMALNVVVYTTTPVSAPAASEPAVSATQPPQLRVRIDGGAPRRVEGAALAQWTRADVTHPLPAGDREPTLGFADVAGRGRLYPHLVVVGLGDDLPAGAHVVELVPDPAARGWARAFVLTGAAEDERAFQWRGTGATDPTVLDGAEPPGESE